VMDGACRTSTHSRCAAGSGTRGTSPSWSSSCPTTTNTPRCGGGGLRLYSSVAAGERKLAFDSVGPQWFCRSARLTGAFRNGWTVATPSDSATAAASPPRPTYRPTASYGRAQRVVCWPLHAVCWPLHAVCWPLHAVRRNVCWPLHAVRRGCMLHAVRCGCMLYVACCTSGRFHAATALHGAGGACNRRARVGEGRGGVEGVDQRCARRRRPHFCGAIQRATYNMQRTAYNVHRTACCRHADTPCTVPSDLTHCCGSTRTSPTSLAPRSTFREY
jgi:hypothetical protein